MTTRMFRQVALERLSTPEQLDQTVRVVSSAAWLGAAGLAALLVGGVVWSMVAAVPEKITGRGILINPGGMLDVIASTRGRVTRFQVHSGDWVAAGQVVAEVSQPDLENELADARSRLDEAVRERARLAEFHQRDSQVQQRYAEQKREALVQQRQAAEARRRWMEERAGIEQGLLDKGLLPRQRVVNTRIEINNAREDQERAENDAKRLDIEISSQAIARERERTAQDDKVARLERDVAAVADRLRRNREVVSPYAGQVIEFKVNPGEVVEPGRELFSMMPGGVGPDGRHDAEMLAKLYVRPGDGKKVRPGMTARIVPSTVRREEYGFIEARVVEVSAVPSSAEGIMRELRNHQLVQDLSGGGAPFEVTVDLVRDPTSNDGFKWSSSRGPASELNPGTLADGSITVRQIRLIGLAIPALDRLLGPP